MESHGSIFLIIGAIGVIVPILPTTPFLLLTAILYAKGSERFHKWFLSTKIYKKYIEDFITNLKYTVKEELKESTFKNYFAFVGGAFVIAALVMVFT